LETAHGVLEQERSLTIAHWSTARIVGLSLGWIIVVVGYHVTRFMVHMRAIDGDGQIVGISASLSGLLRLAAVVFVPPLILVLIWLAQRRQV
jgi:hypothetical protein